MLIGDDGKWWCFIWWWVYPPSHNHGSGQWVPPMVFHFDDYGYYGRKATFLASCFLLSWSWCVVSHLLALSSFFLFCMCFLFARCCSTSPSRLAFAVCLTNKTKPTKTSTNLRLRHLIPENMPSQKKTCHLPTLGIFRCFFFTVGASIRSGFWVTSRRFNLKFEQSTPRS